ncbi:MAG TPA: protein kinase [Cyanobacteria bacterium UBA11367]|nr:protein kinase [Cyanobacteria bacterium UBA11367]
MLGKVLDGRYKILKRLGSGGFGETYVAEDLKIVGISRQCVVKLLKPSSNDPNVLREAKVLFASEAETLAKLGREHNQIPELLAYFEASQEFYIVQELVEGKPLNVEISDKKRLSETEVIEILKDLLGVLNFVHKNQVIHRDIKPSNLMRRQKDSKMVLIDFGAVKQIQSIIVNSRGQTTFSRVIGTPGYMPNEQQGGKPRYNSDIYALGITAIEALTGLSPYQLQEDPDTGEVLWKGKTPVSKKLETILDKMVRSHFKDRYQTADEVLKDLEKFGKKTAWKLPGFRQFVKPLYILPVLAIIAILGATFTVTKLLEPTKNTATQSSDNPTKTPEKQPDSFETWLERGKTLYKAEKYEEAIAAFEEALKFKPDSFEAWNGKAKSLFYLKKYSDAVVAFNEAVHINSDFEAWNLRGVALSRLNKEPEAIDSYNKALEINANDPIALNNKGVSLYSLEKYDQALEAFDKATSIKLDYPEAWNGKAFVLFQLKQYDKAVASFDKVIELTKDNSEAWYNRGYALYKLEKYNDAITSFEKAYGINPSYAEAWNGKGEALYQLQKYKESLAAFDEAVRLKSDFQKAKTNQALARQRLN